MTQAFRREGLEGQRRGPGGLLESLGAELPAPCWLSHPHPVLRLGLGPQSQKEARQGLLRNGSEG